MNAWALSAVAIAGAMVALWVLSLKLRDASIVDIFWGLGFVAVAWLTALVGEGGEGGGPRTWLVVGLVTLWGLRLAGYLFWRNHARPEDARYVAMRARHGDSWPLRSLFIVFGLQGALMWLICLPVQWAIAAPGALGPFDFAGAAAVLFGVGFESLGDLQLARFKSRPENKGKVMDQGLWRYTRHPNYFGDFVTWWGLFAIAAGSGGGWTVISPLLMSTLLMRVSGVTLLEKGMAGRPGYDDYLRRTRAFFPGPPRP